MSVKDYPTRLAAGYYRVRKSWEDAESQLGQFRLLSSAIAKADANPGYFVFSNEGEVIHPELEIGIEDIPGEIQAEEGAAETIDSPVDAGGDINTGDSAADDPIPEAVEYDCDGNDQPIAYARLSTLMNIRSGNSMDAEPVTTYKKDTLVEILQFCEGNWLRIRCPESETGFAYVSGQEQYLYGIGKKVYTVAAKDNLWKIAEEQIGSGTRYTEIRELNGLTCNVIRVGMKLVMPYQSHPHKKIVRSGEIHQCLPVLIPEMS